MGDKSRKIIEKEYCTNTINAKLLPIYVLLCDMNFGK